MPRFSRHALVVLLAGLLAAVPAAAYTVILKDGSRIVAREAIEIEGETAIIILQNGTRTSIAAAEIDFERTREANRNDYGDALVLGDESVRELPTSQQAPRRETLSDLLSRRRDSPGVTAAPPPARTDATPGASAIDSSGTLDYRLLQRRPFADMEIASEVQRQLRTQGVEQVLLYQGSEAGRMLLDVTADSEASVFRALEVAANALLRVRDSHAAKVQAFELLLATSDRDPAGQFLLTVESARMLAEDRIAVSAFFVDRVRF